MMRTHDLPVRDQEMPLAESHEGQPAEQANEASPPAPVAARSAEQTGRRSTPAAPMPAQPLPAWTGNPPGTPPPTQEDGRTRAHAGRKY